MEGKLPEGENILSSLDNSSMADINGSYQQAVKELELIPVNRKSLVAIMFLLLIPFTPLLFTIYSFSELISKMENLLII